MHDALGETLFRQGAAADAVRLILSGRLGAGQTSPGDHHVIIQRKAG